MRREGGAGLGELGCEPLNARRRTRQLGERELRRPHVDGGLARLAGLLVSGRLGELGVGQLEQAAGLRGSIHDAGDGDRAELRPQARHGGIGGVERGGRGGARARQGRDRAGQVFLDIAQGVKGVLLRLEQVICLIARRDDALEGRAFLFVGLGFLVIEFAPHAERLSDELFRLRQRSAKPLGGRRPKLCFGEPELLLARRERVVELHEATRGRLIELGDRLLLDRRGHGAPRAPRSGNEEPGRGHAADEADAEHNRHDRDAPARVGRPVDRSERRGQAVGVADDAVGPPIVAQRGHEPVGFSGRELLVGRHKLCANARCVLAVVDGDGEQRIAVTEARKRGGFVGPGEPVERALEAIDDDDEELRPARVEEPVERSFDARNLAVEHSRLVEYVHAAQIDGRHGKGGRARAEQEGGGENRYGGRALGLHHGAS